MFETSVATLPETNSLPLKLDSYWKPPFLGATVDGRIPATWDVKTLYIMKYVPYQLVSQISEPVTVVDVVVSFREAILFSMSR